VTVTDLVVESVSPLESVTVSLTVKVPALEYVWLAVLPVLLAVESPHSQVYEEMVAVPAAVEPAASTVTLRSSVLEVKPAVGAVGCGAGVLRLLTR